MGEKGWGRSVLVTSTYLALLGRDARGPPERAEYGEALERHLDG
jgi:hypothetical protein